jgi:hypothetical protein
VTDPGRPVETSALLAARSGDDWISRKITTNGVISVAWQEISCGKHRSGHRVDIHVQGPTLPDRWRGRHLGSAQESIRRQT